jgi:predicted Zn finger-like uncharacterized protein
MVVSCERCGSQYRVREDKLPPSGGRIKCPSCNHIFIVRPSAADTATPAAAPLEVPENLSETVPPGARFDLTRKAPIPEAKASAEDPSTVDGPSLDDNRTWKLRLGGLTYAFHSRDSLQQWLVARDNLSEVKLTREGESWRSLEEYPDLLTPQLRNKLQRSGDAAAGAAAIAGASPSSAASVGGPFVQQSGPSTSPFDAVTADDIAQARANRPGAPASAAAAARKTLAGLQAVSAPLNAPAPPPAQGRKAPRKGEPQGKDPKSSSATSLWVTLVLLVAATAALHALGFINLGFIIPSLDNKPTSPVLIGDPPPTAPAASTANPATDPPPDAPPLMIARVDEDRLGQALASTPLETPEERAARIAQELTQAPALAASSSREDWDQAVKILENSLLPEYPNDVDLYRALARAAEQLGDADRLASAQAKVAVFEQRAAARAAQITQWYQDAQLSLKNKQPGEALRLARLLIAEDPASIEYHQVLVQALTRLNQDAERARAQATLDNLILAKAHRDALDLIDARAFDDAIKLIERELLKRQPNNPDYLILVINAYTERDNKRDAKKLDAYKRQLERTRDGKAP